MGDLQEEKQVCPRCGYQEGIFYNPQCLAPDTKIGKYLICNVNSQNGESAVYRAWDTVNEQSVLIKEFLPLRIASREEDTKNLQVTTGCETRYKYFKASFEDINKTMMQMAGVDCLIPTLEIIEEHNTAYVVYKYIDLVPLSEYLEKIDGQELWCKAKRYLLPLYNGVSNLHKKGITHQGICPSNIFLDKNQRPYLTGFSISEVRTDKGELDTELFPGFSAPEQYSLESWQGTWTDVYSLAAVTYRVLTGKVPPSASQRLENDTLVPAMDLDFTITENISDAIQKGLEPQAQRRYQNIDEFTEKLLKTDSSNTAVFQLEDEQKIYDVNPDTVHLEAEHSIKQRKVTRLYTVVTMMVTLIVLVVFGATIYKQFAVTPSPIDSDLDTEPEEWIAKINTPKTTIGESNTVPNFWGQDVTDVISNTEYDDKYHFEVQEKYSEELPRGLIIDQNPPEGTVAGKKSTISFTVSKGSEMVDIPQVTNMTQEEAIEILTKRGFQYKVIEGEEEGYEDGTVFRSEPVAFTRVKKSSNEIVILYVAKEEPLVQEPVVKEPTKKIIINPKNLIDDDIEEEPVEKNDAKG